MLQTSPFHRENYSRLILGVVIQFYQRCSDRFQMLTSTSAPGSLDPRIALAAQWAQKSELQPPLSELKTSQVCDATLVLAVQLNKLDRRTIWRSKPSYAARKLTLN
jgi:exocyst complex component 4